MSSIDPKQLHKARCEAAAVALYSALQRINLAHGSQIKHDDPACAEEMWAALAKAEGRGK